MSLSEEKQSSETRSLSRLPTLILFFLTAVGVPTAAGLTFADKVTQNPWLALFMAALYEMVVFTIGFAAKVWQRLESRWVDQAADWLDAKRQLLFSRYYKRYLQHLIYQHRDFDVKGLTTQGIHTLELERVFVELSVVPQPAHVISAAPVKSVPETLREGQHTIWDYLKSAQMGGQNLAIIGAPGSGKSTLLKHLVLVLTEKRRRSSAASN